MEYDDNKVRTILGEAKVIAVVGLSPKEGKPSNIVARYLKKAGYRVIPVNPTETSVLGETCYGSLLDIPVPVDIVDIFMRPDRLLPVVEEAVAIHPSCIWLQLGIVNDEARRLAETKGIPFIQNACVKIEHTRLFRPGAEP
jgi:uncharacterized protein